MTLSPSAVAPSAPPRSVRSVGLHDPLVQPMLRELAIEYGTRYRSLLSPEQLRQEMEEYPAAEFRPPHGELLLLFEAPSPGAGTRTVAGGAFRRRTEPELGSADLVERPGSRARDGSPRVPTAELKRIWTHSAHRRRGLSRVVLAELERRALTQGYRRLYLTTGPRQPEAISLYLTSGYTPLFDPAEDPEVIGPHPFEKWLVPA